MTTREEIVTRNDGDLIRFHRMVIERIYHEDGLLATRTYNYLTINVFLAGLLVVAQTGTTSGLLVLIAGFGVLLAVLQAAMGRANERAIEFWRLIARSVESQLGTPFDSAMFNYFKWRAVDFPGLGVLDPSKFGRPRKPVDIRTSSGWWKLKSSSLMVGVAVPLVVGSLWLIGIGFLTNSVGLGILLGVLFAAAPILAARAANAPVLPSEWVLRDSASILPAEEMSTNDSRMPS